MTIDVRQATIADTETVSSILSDAAAWLQSKNMPLWSADELLAERIAKDVRAGLFFLAEYAGEPAGTLKFQLSDSEFWPDVPETESAFIHRLAVRRRFAGGAVSTALMSWAVQRTASLGRSYLRLDCEASRGKLRALYDDSAFSTTVTARWARTLWLGTSSSSDWATLSHRQANMGPPCARAQVTGASSSLRNLEGSEENGGRVRHVCDITPEC